MTKIKNFFKNITNSKKKVFALALSVCVVVLSIASSSIAYFTDTDEYTNAFTSGNVDIKLLVNDLDVTNANPNYTDAVFPGKVVPKLTKIDNVGSEDAYIGAIITIKGTGIGNIMSTVDDDDQDVNDGKLYVGNLITGLPASGATVTVTNIDNGFVIYVVYNATVKSADEPVTVFSNITISSDWNNEEMDIFEAVTLDVKAYAVQSAGMTSGALAALKDAFDAFDSLS